MGSRPARHRYCRCGTHLAADNTGRQCAQCERTSRDKLIAPPEVPAEFWQAEQLREAFAAQHIGRVARAYRMHPYHHAVYGPGGISQTLLGQWLGLRQPHVSRIETAPPIRDLDTLVYWARVLRIPPGLLWFDMPGSRRHTTTNASTMSLGDMQSSRAEEDATKRREAIASISKALAAALHPAISETVDRLGIGGSQRRIDNKLVAAHQEIAQALAELYRSADPRSVLPIMTAYADQLLDLLDVPMGDSYRAALNTIAVGAHAQAGLWACHLHKPALAYRYLATGREVAAASGDRSLHARSLGALSYLFSSAPRGGQGGNPQHCLELLDEALDLARHADPFTRGWLATWRADQHATLGNLDAARADLHAAGHGLGSADQSVLEGFFSRSTYGYGMEGHLIRLRTMTFALSGDQLNLEHSFSEVLSSTANLRHQVCALANLAVVSAVADEPERACCVLGRSIQLAAQEHYTMGIQRAIGVRQRFDPNWKNLPAVRHLDEQFHHLTAS
ncbi:MAG: hypothetical protein M3460_00410 [Actinomycetota bacterium]|nr:hypothetical protein [Actinomycetota bacterium]